MKFSLCRTRPTFSRPRTHRSVSSSTSTTQLLSSCGPSVADATSRPTTGSTLLASITKTPLSPLPSSSITRRDSPTSPVSGSVLCSLTSSTRTFLMPLSTATPLPSTPKTHRHQARAISHELTTLTLLCSCRKVSKVAQSSCSRVTGTYFASVKVWPELLSQISGN